MPYNCVVYSLWHKKKELECKLNISLMIARKAAYDKRYIFLLNKHRQHVFSCYNSDISCDSDKRATISSNASLSDAINKCCYKRGKNISRMILRPVIRANTNKKSLCEHPSVKGLHLSLCSIEIGFIPSILLNTNDDWKLKTIGGKASLKRWSNTIALLLIVCPRTNLLFDLSQCK